MSNVNFTNVDLEVTKHGHQKGDAHANREENGPDRQSVMKKKYIVNEKG